MSTTRESSGGETTVRTTRDTSRKLGVIARHREISISELIEEEFAKPIDRLYQQALQEMTAAAGASKVSGKKEVPQ